VGQVKNKEFILTKNHINKLDYSYLTDTMPQKKLNRLPIIAFMSSSSPILFYLLATPDIISSKLFILAMFAFSFGGIIAGGTALLKFRKRLNAAKQILSLQTLATE
jgi:hypothetical protein